MGLTAGDRFETPDRRIEDGDVGSLVARGGYVHPLFTDKQFAARSPFGRRPLPGAGLLLLMGGLVEQTGRFDEVVALLGFNDVQFVAPAFPGDGVRVIVEVLGIERRVATMRCRCVNHREEPLVEATAQMLLQKG